MDSLISGRYRKFKAVEEGLNARLFRTIQDYEEIGKRWKRPRRCRHRREATVTKTYTCSHLDRQHRVASGVPGGCTWAGKRGPTVGAGWTQWAVQLPTLSRRGETVEWHEQTTQTWLIALLNSRGPTDVWRTHLQTCDAHITHLLWSTFHFNREITLSMGELMWHSSHLLFLTSCWL